MRTMNEYLLKILVVGDGNVGKSSFVHRYVDGMFTKTYKMTVGGTAASLWCLLGFYMQSDVYHNVSVSWSIRSLMFTRVHTWEKTYGNAYSI